jgi:hypothetical protein
MNRFAKTNYAAFLRRAACQLFSNSGFVQQKKQ